MIAFDINMGYYTIKFSPRSKDMKNIVTEFGELRYNKLLVGMRASGDIF